MTIYEKYEQATEQYLASLKTVNHSTCTYAKYRFVLADFGAFLKAHCGDSEQKEVAPLLVVQWRNEIKNSRDVGNNTVGHYLTVLHSFFRWAIEHKIFAEQPVQKGDKPKQETVTYDLLTEQEIEKILSGKIPRYSRGDTGLRNKALVTLVLTSGVRVSELINLRIGDLDFEKHVITVRHGKGDKRRAVTFPSVAEQVIGEYLNSRQEQNDGSKQAFLFEYNDNNGIARQYTRQNVTQVVKSYVYRLTGHKDIGAHDLRHSYASYLLTHGVPIQEIQALLGHENYSTTLIYASHLCPERVATNLNAIFAAS